MTEPKVKVVIYSQEGPTCGGDEFYLTKDGRYLCSRCHPEPQQSDMDV